MRGLLEDARSFSLASDPGGRYPCKSPGCDKTFAQVCSAMRHERRVHQFWRSKMRSSGSFAQSDEFGPVMDASNECYDDDDVCITAVSVKHGDGDYLHSHWSRNGNGGSHVPSLGDERDDQHEGMQPSSDLARDVDANRRNQNQPNDTSRL